MADLLEEIARTDGAEIEKVLSAVLDRYAVLYPDWDVTTFSLQKSDDRNEQIDRIIAIMQSFKTPS
jgi:hypothetical protein